MSYLLNYTLMDKNLSIEDLVFFFFFFKEMFYFLYYGRHSRLKKLDIFIS